MRRVRAAVAAGVLAGMTALSGCGGQGSSGAPGASDDVSSTSAEATSAPASVSAPEPGDASLPDAVSVADLAATDVAEGLVLVHEDAAYGCVILTYSGGQLKKRGTFAAFVGEHQPSWGPCDVRRYYASDFSARVGGIYVDYVNANDFTNHVALQQIDQAEKDISGNETLTNPAIGPDDKVYVNHAGTPSVMNMDGSGLSEVPQGRLRPAWLGGLMVPADLSAVSNDDGSLAVEYLSKVSGAGSGYRIGAIRSGAAYGPSVDGDVVIPKDGEALRPLAWVGADQFLTSSGGVIYLTRVVQSSGDEKPSLTTEALATLPEQYVVTPAPVNQVVVCQGAAYLTISLGGTQALPTEQSVLLGVDLDDGAITAHTSIKDESAPGDQRVTEVLGCRE